jgi:ABC-type dipeptide/oligopeptide/nickel transport system permease component
MLNHIAQRLAMSVPVLLGVLLFGFLLLQLVPADPAAIVAGPTATPELVAQIRQDLGLDRPVFVQFGIYLGRVLQGDLGVSLISNTSVIAELGEAIGPTAELMFACLVWAVPLGIALGTIAAVYRGRLLDRIVIAISVAGVSTPVFFIGLILMQYIALPALTLGLIFIGPIARMTRTAALEVLSADHVRTARAKGLSERAVVLRHVLRNALIPVVTLIGLQAGYLLGGAVVTETIYSWPGVGRLAVGAILASDFPLAQGAILVLALAFLVINLIVDMLYAVLDPRVEKHG